MRAEAESLTLRDVGRLDFRTSRAGENATASLQRALGLQYRYQPARLAIARSIGVGTEPPPVSNNDGKVIRGETLFGPGPDELAIWLGLMLSASQARPVSRRALQDLVAAHWARGASLMWDDLRDQEEPVEALALQVSARATGSRTGDRKRR